ncbi:MAG: carbamoyl-phosphate synthase (glutamine-hydrolyzing) large subunit [Candidatus Magasanikbacteria bacterium]|nr:carbamoyl-phosphate synthase (glutamine-hydrolyzing) large subunit [Candidatus Magasanikbacteria bacterium]
MSNKSRTAKFKKPKKVLILGSGGLKIGQAGEFDYSGSQAIKALKEEGISTVLMNPNIATVQTDQDMADEVYFLPLTMSMAERIIEKEQPDALLLSFGGQTALNVGLELEDAGILKKHKVRTLGTSTKTIRLTEDRNLFAQRLRSIDVSVAKSTAVESVSAGIEVVKKIGFPIMMRCAFSLGGEGSGLVKNTTQLKSRLRQALSSTSQVLIEEDLGGWKEVEYEVVRDVNDNCVTVCNMENLDPMGIHTGESIVVAPSQTLNNHEYHKLRAVAIKVVRDLGIVGECNIQYALNPDSDEYRVIEVNARLSRSSALASKATGYPLAWVAAKLALGYTLLDLQNSVTQSTSCFFEPSLDYLALKIPRWDLKKFKYAERTISTEMKSVGEIMALGRSFEEVLQKGIRMTNIGARGIVANDSAVEDYLDEIKHPTDQRIFAVAEAFKQGHGVDEIYKLSKIDRWFLQRIKRIVDISKKLPKQKLNDYNLREVKKMGFSDEQIGVLTKKDEKEIRSIRKKLKIVPVVKQVDTLAGEFPAKTNYLYLTYHGTEHDIIPGKKQMIVLGGGPYRIGSSVEFDWCCVQAVKTLSKQGYGSIMINSNPETVSTDYDECDRLYFDELSYERVLDIYEFEGPEGLIVSMGGQIPNNLAIPLHEANVKIVGTSPQDIDRAENRFKFSQLLDTLGVDQPQWEELVSTEDARKFANRVGYPVLIRPSYVLSGAAMNVVFDEANLESYLKQAVEISKKHPTVISKFIEGAREIEIDGVAQGGELKVCAITEHVENAGVHSGDAHSLFPSQKISVEMVRRTKKHLREVLKALNITGPFNVQFLVKDNHVKIIELNLRASRSFPFVSKSLKMNFAQLAIEVILGKKVVIEATEFDQDYVTVKAPQFSYSRIKGVDPVLGVEMGSTGEIATFGKNYQEAVLKSMLAAGYHMPKKAILVSIGKDEDKALLLPFIKDLSKSNYKLYATEGTSKFLTSNKIKNTKAYKISVKKKPAALQVIEDGVVDLVINIPQQSSCQRLTDGYYIRRTAVDYHVPLISNKQIAKIFVNAICNLTEEDLQVKAWSEY